VTRSTGDAIVRSRLKDVKGRGLEITVLRSEMCRLRRRGLESARDR